MLIALILACGVWMWYWNTSQPQPGEPVAHLIPGICTSCSKVYQETVTWVPSRCRFCGKPTLYEAKKCAKCGSIEPLVKTDRDRSAEFKCRKCGATEFIDASESEIPRP